MRIGMTSDVSQAAMRPEDLGHQLMADGVLTVLVLDDSAAQRAIIAKHISGWGHRVISASDPFEALEVARETDIDLVVCDWMMPGMTGPEFCRKLRAEQREMYIYVLMLTSKTARYDVTEGFNSGADDFMSKPINKAELQARMTAGVRVVTIHRAIHRNNLLLEATLDELQTVYGVIDRDLDEARRLQLAQLQDRHRTFPSADVSLMLEASGHVGGDMVGYFSVDRRTIGLYSLDVSGHGVASGMIAARIAGQFSDASPDQNLALMRREDGGYAAHAPEFVAAKLNAMLLREMTTDRYLTLCLCYLDLPTGKVTLVQAGHPHPIVLRADGHAELVGQGGLPIGLLPGATFDQVDLQLARGDRLLMFSDGLTECPNPDGDFLEEEGLARVLERLNADAGTLDLDMLHRTVSDFAGTTEFPDDVSALLVHYTGR